VECPHDEQRSRHIPEPEAIRHGQIHGENIAYPVRVCPVWRRPSDVSRQGLRSDPDPHLPSPPSEQLQMDQRDSRGEGQV